MQIEQSPLPGQFTKIIERLFVFVDTRDVNVNILNQLAVNPQIIKILFKQLEFESNSNKLSAIEKVSNIYQANQFNSLILLKRDQEILQFNHSILESIVLFIYTIQIQPANVPYLTQLLQPFVVNYPINCKIVKTVLSILIKDFYQESISHHLLQMSLGLLKVLLSHQKKDEASPSSYFITYGQEGGLKTRARNIKWPFAKGFHFYTKFYIDNLTNQEISLFTLSIQNDQFLVYLTPDSHLTVKIFSQDQTISICPIQPKKWITLSLSYSLNRKIFKSHYDLTVTVNGDRVEKSGLPVPSISMVNNIVELSIGRNLYGRIHAFVISRSEIIMLNGKLNLNTWTEIESFLVVNKKNLRDMFAIYTPILISQQGSKDILYDISSQNHGEMMENTGIYSNPFAEVDINYYGGLYTYLPLLHLLKFYSPEQAPQILTEIFQLYLVFFEGGFGGVEVQAINCQFLSIGSQLINQLNPNFMTVETVKAIHRLNNSLNNLQLRQQMLLNFIFKLSIRRIKSVPVISNLLQIAQNYYHYNFEWSYNLLNLDDLFHYIIDNFQEDSNLLCCLHHYSCSQDPDKPQAQEFNSHYLLKNTPIVNLLKVVFKKLPNCQAFKSAHTRVMQLLFQKYSPCLKLLLLQCMKQGVKVNNKFYVQNFNVIGYLHLYLEQVLLPQELACVIEMLLYCQVQDSSNLNLKLNNIHRISKAVDRIYVKQCQDNLFNFSKGAARVNTHKKAASTSGKRKRLRRHSSLDLLIDLPPQKSKTQTTQSSLQQKIQPIQTNKALYQSIILLCFQYDHTQQQWLLRDDDYCFILQPYFRLCCTQYRKNIVSMFRNTVVMAYGSKQIEQNSQRFDKLFKLLLTQSVHRQLEVNQFYIADRSNEVIKNVYFILDFTVIHVKDDWIHLYLYVLRLIGILEQSKIQIAQKTHQSVERVTLASKIAIRNFITRVVKLAEQNVQNMTRVIFLLKLVVFGNINSGEEQPEPIFKHFNALQKYLFVGDPRLLDAQEGDPSKIQFLDAQLILDTVKSLKIYKFDLVNAQEKHRSRMIQAYLDLEYTNQQSQLFQNRSIFLKKAQFKQLKKVANQNIFKDFFQGKKEDQFMLSTGQIISTAICLCVESALNTHNLDLLKQSIHNLQHFFLWFLLLSSRDGLKQQNHDQRNLQLPKNIASNVINFLYTIIGSYQPKEYMAIISKSIENIFLFIALLVECFSQKIGQKDSFQKGIQKAQLLRNVQQYNLFTFYLLKQVFTLKEITAIPTLSPQKLKTLIFHPKISGYFKNKLTLTIDTKISETSLNHMKNMKEIKRDVQQFFVKAHSLNLSNKFYSTLINENQFRKQFVQEYLRKNNMNYRKIQRIWIKIWKRLRLYHYYWSVSMNQRQSIDLPFKKSGQRHYRHKFSKFVDNNGVRPVLEVEHVEPWHVKKMLMEKQFQYRNSNYLYHLHQQAQIKKKQKTFLQKLMKSQVESVFYVEWIKHNSKRKGYLSIQNQKMKFKYISTFQKDSHLDFSSFILAQYKPVQKYWPLIQISDIYERRYLTKRQCILIEFQEGTSLIFNFPNQDKNQFLQLLQSKQNKPEKYVITRLNKINFYTKKFTLNSLEHLEEATLLWKAHKISNFKYLMLVNKFGGRSYLDPANYPVFPWILSTYNQPQYTYRDMTKTVGALGSEERIKFFMSKVEATDPFEPVPPYQFGTHYSSPGVVFNFMIRLQPYTQASRTLQGGKFDLSDRLFASLRLCWNSVISQVSDVRQLTPQFFYMPQILLNIQQHDFGTTQQKNRVHNVELPQWAQNAYDFIVKHRQELQSDNISQQIGNWIDLVFGSKQRGKIAEQNLNLFYYLTYQGAIDLKDITDQQTKISKQAQIMHFGQTPSQLWTRPHGNRQKHKKFTFSLKKITLVFSLQNISLMSILSIKQSNIILFNNYNILFCTNQNPYKVQRQISILRNNSKQHIYFLEDIQCSKRIQIFNQQKYIAVASYINGDLLVYSLAQGKKVEQKKGTPKLCIHVNQRQDLMLVGSRNGLLQVYQIVYGDKDTLTLIKIASQYYMAPIHSISEGANFFTISSGSLVTLIRASRSLNYVYNKFKMRGVKMIRALELPRKVEDCIIATDPLFCFIITTSLELYCYSGNGQLLASKHTQLQFPPVKFTANFMDYIAYIQNNKLKILSLPFLKQISELQLPNKKFVEMRFHEHKCFIVTKYGQIITLSEDTE